MELVILMGLQASGKSTFVRERLASTHVHVSRDHFRNARNPSRRQAFLVEEALAAGRSVAVDNTNPTIADRAVLIAQAQQFQARVFGYYLESKVAECLERNASRNGVARVPDVGVFATVKRLVRPSLAEGFHELSFVRIRGGAFEVLPWQDESSIGEGS